ncbi:hypothetical protein [Colwellia sp. UCD-KL20]|nr:hypothetical protein [Colwellia sp. UCD-KL20]
MSVSNTHFATTLTKDSLYDIPPSTPANFHIDIRALCFEYGTTIAYVKNH